MIVNKGSAGGKATAIILRREALAKYYANPHRCLFCNKVIDVPEGVQVSSIKSKRFCNRSCAGFYNNAHFHHNTRVSTSVCSNCGAIVNLKKQKNGGYPKRKYCDTCLRLVHANGNSLVMNYNKGEHFGRHKNWQSARSMIQRHARRVYLHSGLPRKCRVCGYDNHIEISHLIPVKSFASDTSLMVINAISNLIPLCPNHHWEYDEGLLRLG
jgi:DNA-directed RNA polymerase subunit M/transcription elongation factor TFIIS